MESLLKIGDKVRVKSKYDPGCGATDYPQSFVSDMVLEHGGKLVTICSCFKRSKTDCRAENGDLYTYQIVEDSHHFAWTSSMFDLKSNPSVFVKRRHKTKLKFTL